MKRVLNQNKGFTLIELLVVVVIFIIMTTIVIINQNKFSSDISISNVAYALALDIRQAQVYGILVRTQDRQFESAYGIHFEKKGTKIEYFIFADSQQYPTEEGYFKYDGEDGDPIGGVKTLQEGNRIKDICTYRNSRSDAKCFNSGSGQISSVDIVFRRPDPTAIISDPSSIDFKKEVNIFVESSLGDKKHTIKTFSSGQISVYNN